GSTNQTIDVAGCFKDFEGFAAYQSQARKSLPLCIGNQARRIYGNHLFSSKFDGGQLNAPSKMRVRRVVCHSGAFFTGLRAGDKVVIFPIAKNERCQSSLFALSSGWFLCK